MVKGLNTERNAPTIKDSRKVPNVVKPKKQTSNSDNSQENYFFPILLICIPSLQKRKRHKVENIHLKRQDKLTFVEI